MKTRIECPNCCRAYLITKKLYPGKREKNTEIRIVCECPYCRVLFREQQLGIRLNKEGENA